MEWKKIDPVVIPRSHGGVDWSADRHVLLRDKGRLLFWRPGCKVWMDRVTGYAYTPGILVFLDTNPKQTTLCSTLGKTLHEGGRCASILKSGFVEENIKRMFAWQPEPGQLDVTLPPLSLRWTIEVISSPNKPKPVWESEATDRLVCTFQYTNYKGEESRRHVKPLQLFYGSTQWHPKKQWILQALDLDKNEARSFALSDGTVLGISLAGVTPNALAFLHRMRKLATFSE